MFIRTFFLTMTDIITSQNTDLFSGMTLYFSLQKWPDQFWHG